MKKYEREKTPFRSELLSTSQLEHYAVALAESHVISSASSPEILIRRLNENEEILIEVRNLLIASAKANSHISAAGEWLLDNFYLIEDQIQTGKKHFPKGFSESLPRLLKGPFAGYPRVYSIAIEIISHSDGRVDLDNLNTFINAYQQVATLNIGELWAIPIMLRLALIENLRRLAAQIAMDRINKNLADYWADRMIEIAEKDPKSLIVVTADMARSSPPMVSSFVAEITRRLLGKGPALTLPLTWIEQRLSETGLTSNGLIYQETQKEATAQVSMSNSIGSLRFINITDWREFVERTSAVEQILRRDTRGIYERMDFHTRDHYRHRIENLAKQSKMSETAIAALAIELTKEESLKELPDPRREHVGYFLVDQGLKEIEKIAGIRYDSIEIFSKWICSSPFILYSTSITLLSLLLAGLTTLHAYREGVSTGWLIVVATLSLVAVSHLAVAFVNWLVTLFIPPDFLPRMDYSKSIPPEAKTLVVVPSLFSNIDELKQLVEMMEVRYLANRQENLHFALLTDFKDADVEITDEEKDLLQQARECVTDLNRKYKHESRDAFFLLHRPRKWNDTEQKWMGYERKRGKLGDLNTLISGEAADRFLFIEGKIEVLRQVRYVITLDSDTQLPREAAWKITATIDHPLNRPYYDENKKRVTKGYGILQPRLATSIPQITASLFSKIYSTDQGIDPYTRAVSDVYQDLLGEGSFIGKGVYEVEAFERSLGNKFPENRILSHDLLEGCHARSGLISDVQLYEDYPSGFLADMKRRHRWIRGDWQIGRWMYGRVPGSGGHTTKNPLSALSKWKIFDNLRRSLVPIALLILLLFGWTISSTPWFWTITVIGIIIPPSILAFLLKLYKKPEKISWFMHADSTVASFLSTIYQHIWTIISLPFEALSNIDAILRTLWRMFVSKKNLLQWDPSNAIAGVPGLSQHYRIMWIGPILGILMFAGLQAISWNSFVVASSFAVLWILSPFLAWVISLPQPQKRTSMNLQQLNFLRSAARRTWAFFEKFIGPEDNWLPPDNYQEYPAPRIAHRTSPTNIGLSLLSTLAAYDFGYVNAYQLAQRLSSTFITLKALHRYKGHFFNWYDTQSLAPLHPRYVSTVDSGNLAACLLTLKQGLLTIPDDPVIRRQDIEGLLDTLRVIQEKSDKGPIHQRIKQELQSQEIHDVLTPQAIHHMVDKISVLVDELHNHSYKDEDEMQWWIHSLQNQCNSISHILSVIESNHDGIIPSVREVSLFNDTNNHLQSSGQEITRMFENLAEDCRVLSSYEYDFLFDKSQHYFAIGYNVEDHRRDAGYYDLLGSEARLGIYIAIAQGKIPQDSWFSLGRQLTSPGNEPVLISWSGSMFEYLMPLLVMPVYPNTLLDTMHKGAVRHHIDYGRKRGLPWGISESCFNMVHANLDYQYKAFGVPGLGLKRGLGDDYVVAPYATFLALMVAPEEAYENLKQLSQLGYEGDWGFYEAIDYTPARLQRGQQAAVVKAYMTHHQGMSFLSLSYLLTDKLMPLRFQSDLQLQTSLLLLQEKVPLVTAYYTPAFETEDIQAESISTEWRVINTSLTPVPEVQLLSNGRYHVMISNAGGGYSRWKNMAVTRWREDGTCDPWGNFCYIRDIESNDLWSAAHQPTGKVAERYEVIYSQGRAEFRRLDHQIEAHTEIVVSPEDDVELRRIHFINRSRKKRMIEVTSYAEIVLNDPVAEMLHPAFSNLFVQTEILDDLHAILCTRRPRSAEERPLWFFHIMKVHRANVQQVTFETSRENFIGRGYSLAAPKALQRNEGLSGSHGSVLDPIAAIQYRFSLEPYETVIADIAYGIGKTREICKLLVEKYQDKFLTDRAFELAWTHSNVVLRQINATASDAMMYCRLAGSIIYANASFRADPGVIMKNQRGQSGLWSHSISGDWPIVLVQIEEGTNIGLVQQLIQAHAFWKLKGLIVDLVIWNEDHGGYRQILNTQILSMIPPSHHPDHQELPGGIFVRSAEQLSNEDRILFQTVARVIISDKLGTLEGQLSRRKQLKPQLPNFVPQRFYSTIDSPFATDQELIHFNGIGGYSKDGKEYVIITTPQQVTPAPWSNVLANPHFGTVISESGQSYTWFQNAHELRLTPWMNDPITDMGGEHFYIRDEETGKFWSPCPLPVRGRTPYTTRHGFGYSTFEHEEDGLYSHMTVFVDPDRPIKYTTIRFKNRSAKTRQFSVTGYVEWVLGDLRFKTMMHIITELDLNTGAILARNSYHTEFGQLVAFFDVNESTKSITTDREEFVGRNGSLHLPQAMVKSKLSGKTGAALDPCAVIRVPFMLMEGEEYEVSFRLGTGMHINDVTYLIRESRSKASAHESLQKVKDYWNGSLNVIRVTSPDSALDLMTNGWLNYQTIACRMWARSGYYQSGGAFGFRDQLQDVLSLLHNEPRLARQQILLCASRQFTKGDVQHWWHPPVGRGVRTRCSDDYLWLPYVTAKYVLTTGDVAILDEQIPFLESRELARDEHDYYDLPIRSDQSGTLYEHCLRAFTYGFRFGANGLPLMGSGDWNDGMDRVGIHGRGESIWLGWFLYDCIRKFQDIISMRNDTEVLKNYEHIAEELRRNLDKHGWDGAWYRRAYFDDGTPLGSTNSDECKIDSIAQSWGVISGAGDPEKTKSGMEEAYRRLINKEKNIIQLFDPPFDQSNLEPGYIKGYVPGVRENGGQYTHAALWMIMAFAIMRDRKKMSDLLRMVIPVYHADTAEKMRVYKVEPYVIAADVYAVAEHTGRGGWTWYTGSAGWLYQLIIEYVLGISRRSDSLSFSPCLPPEWDKVKVEYIFQSSVYHITLIQTGSGIKVSVAEDGEIVEGNTILLIDDGREHHVVVTLS